MQKVMQMPKNRYAIRCMAGDSVAMIGLETASEQAIQVKGVGKVLSLSVGEHLHSLDAAGVHELEGSPAAVGKGIHEIFMGWAQHVVAGFEILSVGELGMLRLLRVEWIVKAVDGEDELVEVERLVGTITDAQPQWAGNTVAVDGEGKIDLITGPVGCDIFGSAFAIHDGEIGPQQVNGYGDGLVLPR